MQERARMKPDATTQALRLAGRGKRREGELTFFIPGKLENHANQRSHWRRYATYRKLWREKTHLMAICSANTRGWTGPFSRVPKRITFVAHTWNTLDSDGLQNALKSCRDGLVSCRLIHSDAPDSGHTFSYAQVVDRKQRGVKVTVEDLR